MVQLRVYDKQGNTLASFTSSVRNGRIDYLGGGNYILVDNTGIDQFTIVGATTKLVRTLVASWAVGDAARGVTMQRRMLLGDVEDSLDQEGQAILVGMETTVGGLPAYTLRQYELSSAALLAETTLVTPSVSVWGDIATNGQHFYMAHTDTALPTAQKRITMFALSGATVTQLVSWIVTTMPVGMCHDGLYLWAIEGSNAIQYEQIGVAAPVQVNSFALTGLTISGICTDGQNLIVLSRT